MFGNLSLVQGKQLSDRFIRFGNQGASNSDHFVQDRARRSVSFGNGGGSSFGGMASDYPIRTQMDNFLHDDYMDNNLYGDRRNTVGRSANEGRAIGRYDDNGFGESRGRHVSFGGKPANEGRAIVRYDDNVFGESGGRRVSFGGRPANEGRALMRYDDNVYEESRSRRAPRRTPPQRRSYAEDQVFYKLVPIPISSGNRTRRRSRSAYRDKGRNNYGRRDVSRSSRPGMVRQRYSGRRSSPPNNSFRRSPIGRINRRSNTNNGIYGRNSSGPTKKKHMTPEELDKELEAYMKSSKHPRVELY